MRNIVDIHVILNEEYENPRVDIYARERSGQVENIIYAIENAAENDFPMILGCEGDQVELISQRDIIRVYTEQRKVFIRTEHGVFLSKQTLSALENDLNGERFIRVSQSEIINLYKVKSFDVTMAGTIGIQFDDGTKTWASRSRVKAIRELIRKRGGES